MARKDKPDAVEERILSLASEVNKKLDRLDEVVAQLNLILQEGDIPAAQSGSEATIS